jgi:hypothetical protein
VSDRALPFLLALVAGCGASALPSSSGSADLAGAAATDGAAPAPTPDMAPPPGPDLAQPIACGGFINRPCPSGMFCQTPVGECCCDIPGTCVPLPATCDDNCPTCGAPEPACGCDRKTYASECDATKAGVSIDHLGACAVPFACGSATCQPGQICVQGCSGIGPPPPPSCQAAPAGCGDNPTCACVPSSPLSKCTDLPGGGVLVEQFGCA